MQSPLNVKQKHHNEGLWLLENVLPRRKNSVIPRHFDIEIA